MVPIPELWLPILLSGAGVFVVSSVIHMMLPYHRSDFSGVPQEDKVQDALRGFDIPPGDYVIPYAANGQEMASESYKERVNKGPVLFFTMLTPGMPNMGPQLIQWFVYSLIIGVFAAYLTGRTLAPGEDYLTVFRFAGTVTFVAYSLGLWQNSIWYKRKWSTTMKSTFDGLVYAAVTGGFFGWLWPGA